MEIEVGSRSMKTRLHPSCENKPGERIVKNRIVVGTRGSPLALIQTELVAAEMKKANPGLDIIVTKIVTEGDTNRHIPLEKVAGAGIFVKELEQSLLDGRIDMAVHSLKDMPSELPPGLALLAVPKRADPRDVLVARAKMDELPPGARIGTGSLRRALEITTYRPDLTTGSIRGNVDTRIQKALSGEYDGVVLAAAGILRMDWKDKITQFLPTEHFLPAVGQGAMVVEARSDDKDAAEAVLPINDLPTWQETAAERAFLRALGGGCRAPIAALGIVTGNVLKLDGMVADVSNKRIFRGIETGAASAAEEIGKRLAEHLLARGAAKFING
jgi:hydroxymethylbilane synthase